MMKKIVLLLALTIFNDSTIKIEAMNHNESSSSSTTSPEQDLQTPEKLSPLLKNINTENKNNIKQCLSAMIQLNKEITRLLKNVSHEEKAKKIEKINKKMNPIISQLTQTTDAFLNIVEHDLFFAAYQNDLNELAEKNRLLKELPDDKDYISITNQITVIGTITNGLLNNPAIKQYLKTKGSSIEKALTFCFLGCLICFVGICGYELPKIVNAFALEAAADWAREGTKLLNGTTEWFRKTTDFLEYIKKLNE